MNYEDLAVEDNFSEDEIPFSICKEIYRSKKDKQVLIRAKMLQGQLNEIKNNAV
jgi:hypothetical protein